MRDTPEYGVAMPGKDSPDPGALAALIRTRRKQRGLTQDQVADAAGVGRSTVIRWENGQTEPSREELLPVLEVLQIPREQALQAIGWLPSEETRSREQIVADLLELFPDVEDQATLRDVLELLEIRRNRRAHGDHSRNGAMTEG